MTIPYFKHTVGERGIYPKMFHTHVELFFLLRGNVEYISESARTPLAPYTVVLIPAGVYHQFSVLGNKAEYERMVLEIPAEHRLSLHFSAVTEQQKMFHAPVGSPLFQAWMRLKEYSDERFSEDRAYLTESVCTELLSLLRHESNILTAHSEPIHSLSAQAMKYIHANLNTQLSLSQIANACYAATSTLSHAFRESYGISVTQYIRQKKMALAKNYLRAKKTPGEVALLCGYSEYSTFFRAYVKEYGYSPAEEDSTDDVKSR